jgi:hypothetical protein
VFNAEARSLSAALEEMPIGDFVTLSQSPHPPSPAPQRDSFSAESLAADAVRPDPY